MKYDLTKISLWTIYIFGSCSLPHVHCWWLICACIKHLYASDLLMQANEAVQIKKKCARHIKRASVTAFWYQVTRVNDTWGGRAMVAGAPHLAALPPHPHVPLYLTCREIIEYRTCFRSFAYSFDLDYLREYWRQEAAEPSVKAAAP